MEGNQFSAQSAQPSQNKNTGRNIVIGVLTFLLVGAAGLAYWQYTEAQNSSKASVESKKQLELAQSQINKLQESPESATDQPGDTVPAKDDKAKITEEVVAYRNAAKAIEGATVEVGSINIKDSKYAHVSTSIKGSNTGGSDCWSVKPNGHDQWVVVTCTQDDQSELLKNTYGFPDAFVMNPRG